MIINNSKIRISKPNNHLNFFDPRSKEIVKLGTVYGSVLLSLHDVLKEEEEED